MRNDLSDSSPLRLKHLTATRWFHWINFPLLGLMVWSGLLIYWANDEYSIGPLHFFPESFYAFLGLKQRLSGGMNLHFLFMWLFTINGLLYVSYTIFSGEWRYLVPRKWSDFRDAAQVALHDITLGRAGLPHHSEAKYNAAQRITYTLVVVMGLGSVITGLSIYKPVQLAWLMNLCGGYEAAHFFHFYLTLGYVLFFVVHVLQVAIAGWNTFQAMITGYEWTKHHD